MCRIVFYNHKYASALSCPPYRRGDARRLLGGLRLRRGLMMEVKMNEIYQAALDLAASGNYYHGLRKVDFIIE
jgi:hypothetical protein